MRAPQRPTDPRRLKFSLQYFQPDHPKFKLADCRESYLRHLVVAIQRYSSLAVDEFMQCVPDDPHRHQVPFAESTEPAGFPGIDPGGTELWTDEAWQFGLSDLRTSPEGGWRVHGFIFEGVFYIVWFDAFHQLFLDGHVERR